MGRLEKEQVGRENQEFFFDILRLRNILDT